MKYTFFGEKKALFAVVECAACGAVVHFAGESYVHECGMIPPAPSLQVLSTLPPFQEVQLQQAA